MTTIRASQRLSLLINGNTLSLRPGELAEVPLDKAQDLQRAGQAVIVPTATVTNTKTGESITLPIAERAPAPVRQPETPDREGVAAIIVNYNMPERADALADYIKANCKDVEIILVDNGSDLVPPAQNTAVRLAKNVQTTSGWLMGLQYADQLAIQRGKGYFAYWFLITSAEFVGGDPLAPMVAHLESDPTAVGVHPAVEADIIAWKHLLTRGGDRPRRVWMIDNIASLYRAEWFDSIGRFDPALKFAWGIDIETGYIARKQGRTLWVHEGSRVKKITDIGYNMNRMGMTAQERRVQAEANMEQVLSRRYGPTWRDMLWNAHREPENELVSVIIPTYNRADLLPRALESLKSQTYTNFEAIVVNDGGVDVSEIVARYPFAKYIRHDKNRGLPAARNTAIRASQGAYIAYLDDDDWYYTNHLETLVRGIRGHRAAYSNAHAVDREYGSEKERYVFGNEYTPEFILRQNVFPCNTVLHERSLFDEAGPFDETLPNSEDWDMWIRISKITAWHHIPVVTCAVDRTRPTMSSDRPAMLKVFEQIRARYANGGGLRPATAIDWDAWRGPHPAGISGCVRVRNDGEFLRPAVISHLPYCDEIVLAVQPSEDDTEQIAAELAREYPDKVRVEKYPLIPVYISDPAWETTPEDDPRSFVYLSNWALSKCRYAWINKFEADVIATAALRAINDRIKKEPDRRIYYGRTVLNVAGPEYKLINATVPCNGGWDEGVFQNHPDYRFIKVGKFESINHAIADHKSMGWSGLHLKHAKRRYWGQIKEEFVPFDPENLAQVMRKWNRKQEWNRAGESTGDPSLFDDAWRAYCPPWGTDGK